MTTLSESPMRLHFLLLLLLCCVSPSTFATENAHGGGLVGCLPRQIQAFTQFKNEFDTRGCNHSDFSNGVWCDNSTGEITKLRLSACLSGTLKPNSSLFGLHHLRYLNLSGNNFISSSLPFEFGNLNKLEVLYLSFNGFVGQVPSSFSNLSMLSYLDLSHNELTGSFPLVRNLTKLIALRLLHNHFSGTLNSKSSLFELHELIYLNLAFNSFSSSLPFEFGNLKKLEFLALSSNSFFGPVPPTISNMTSLTALYLAKTSLTGSFPLVQNLTKLSQLHIFDSHFYGTIPSSLFTLPFLKNLDLGGNQFTGSIEHPNSSSSSRLEHLYIGNNGFEGKVLESVSKFITLKVLDISFPKTSYPVDLSLFSSLNFLVYLDVSGNNISRASLRPDSAIPLNLEFLFLSHCGMSEFPKILKALKKLEFIEIFSNKIKGKIPEWFWNFPRLSLMDISNNSFNGFEGSVELLGNSSLKVLNLESNDFEGSLPNLPPSITDFAAGGNYFTGEIPLWVCNRSSLAGLDLHDNNFTGPIPPCLSNVAFVDLRRNNLQGSIPDTFGAGAIVRTLNVGHNQLTGKLPRSLLNCSFLNSLSVDHNRIEDTFPFWLKALPDLEVLVLRSNRFYGPISPPDQSRLGFPELRIFEISDNMFTGSLPPAYFENWKAASLTMNDGGSIYMVYDKNVLGLASFRYTDRIDLLYKGLKMEEAKILTSYATIDFSGNLLEGQIPESLGLLNTLIALNLSNNAFTGHIPLSLANLTELESLDLSRNRLSGSIPSGIGTLSFLAYLNVSHNQLKGEIPQGTQITGQPKSSFEGNAGLCGLPLEESCFGNKAPPTQQPKKEDKEEEEEILNLKGVAIGYGSGVLLGLAISQVISSYKPEWLVKLIGMSKRRNR